MSWQDKLRQVEPYVAGEQPKINNMIKLNTNENPYGPCKQIKDILKEIDIEKLKLYPNSDGEELRHALAKYHGLKDEQVFLGNGSDEVLALTFLTFFNGSDPVLFPNISYSFYPVYCDLYQMNYKEIILDQDFKMYVEDFKQPNSGIIFPNPNAPTGLLVSLDFIEEVLKSNPDSIVVVDEAYIELSSNPDVKSMVSEISDDTNVVVARTFSKLYGLAGVRLGYAMCNKEMHAILQKCTSVFTGSRVALAGAMAALDDEEYIKKTKAAMLEGRKYLTDEFTKMGFYVYPSETNFLYVNTGYNAAEFAEECKKYGLIIRGNFEYSRITVGRMDQNEKMVGIIKKIIESGELKKI